jgi:hypothetical protein
MESAPKRAHQTIVKFDVHFFPQSMSCDWPKRGRVASRLLSTENLMASQPSSRLEMPWDVPGTPTIIPETPFRGTTPAFSTTWQQTYPASMLQFTTDAAHTPSKPTTPFSTASGIFQYNSVPRPSSRRSKKRPNNENPNTPAPKRLGARQCGIRHVSKYACLPFPFPSL